MTYSEDRLMSDLPSERAEATLEERIQPDHAWQFARALWDAKPEDC